MTNYSPVLQNRVPLYRLQTLPVHISPQKMLKLVTHRLIKSLYRVRDCNYSYREEYNGIFILRVFWKIYHILQLIIPGGLAGAGHHLRYTSYRPGSQEVQSRNVYDLRPEVEEVIGEEVLHQSLICFLYTFFIRNQFIRNQALLVRKFKKLRVLSSKI